MTDLAALKARVSLSEIVGRTVALKRSGRELTGCCPFHADSSPSFYVDDDKGVWNCFGCGAAGDVIDFVMRLAGVSLPDAAAMLGASDWTPRDPAKVAKALKLCDDRKTAAIDYARRVWREASPIAGTVGAAYLAGRGIGGNLPGYLRFASLSHPDAAGIFPALLAAVQGLDGQVCGVQRIYLASDGNGKATVPKAKLSLGRIKGAAIRLGPGASELIVSGSLEDGMTVAQSIPDVPVWSCPGEGMMCGLELPDVVRSIVIASDNDPPGVAASDKAAAAFSVLGLRVRIMRPGAAFKDFNAELMGVRQ